MDPDIATAELIRGEASSADDASELVALVTAWGGDVGNFHTAAAATPVRLLTRRPRRVRSRRRRQVPDPQQAGRCAGVRAVSVNGADVHEELVVGEPVGVERRDDRIDSRWGRSRSR